MWSQVFKLGGSSLTTNDFLCMLYFTMIIFILALLFLTYNLGEKK